MNLTLIRKYQGLDCIMGELLIDGVFECYTLEDLERQVKIPGVTAIPRGFYEVIISYSERFKKPLPLLQNVPNFDGVRIHTGNTAANTEGCILVGRKKDTNQILESKLAFEALFPKLQAAAGKEKIILEVKGE